LKKATGSAKSASKLSKTVPGKIQGKFGYMSPEQAMGKELDHRSDLFSLGIIFFEMLTGKRLYGGENTFIRYENVKEARVQPVSKFREVPPVIDRIVTKMLQKNPDDRYQTSGELQKDLSDFLYPANTETVISSLATSINKYFPKQQSQDREAAQTQQEKKRWWQRRFPRLSSKSAPTESPTTRNPADIDGSTLSMQPGEAPPESPQESTNFPATTNPDVPLLEAPTGSLSRSVPSSRHVASGHTMLAPEPPQPLEDEPSVEKRLDRTPTFNKPNVIELPFRENLKSPSKKEASRSHSARIGSVGISKKRVEPLRQNATKILWTSLIVLGVLFAIRLLAGNSNGYIGDLFSPLTGSKLRQELKAAQELKTTLEHRLQDLEKELSETKQRLLELTEQRTALYDQQSGANDKKLRDLEQQFNREQEKWYADKRGFLTQLDALKAQLAEATNKCPQDMAHVPAGKFFFGSAEDDPERNLSETKEIVEQSKEYCMDHYEYPNIGGKLPKVGVTWGEASGLCESQGKRLCSEREWERGCKGPKNNRYLYGNLWEEGACNTENKLAKDGVLAEAGDFNKCANDYGLFDMSGNIAEWTDTGGAVKTNNPVLRGGSYDRAGYWSRCAARIENAPETKGPSIGFRCCRDVR
jgi:formylglycine-generating enzyme required for sulfatase activity